MSKGKKHYIVIYQDEYNNLYYVGDYKHLDDSIKDLNDYIEPVCEGSFKLKKGDLKEYAGTFGAVFDLDLNSLSDDDRLCGLMVRGFILYD